jgi:hypothetical protein
MRIAILLVVGFVLAAGCATNNGGNNGTTPTDNGAGGGNGTTAAKVVKTDTHDFATDAPAGAPAGTPTPTAITIDPGYTTLKLNVTFTGDAPAGGAGVASGVTVKVGSLTCTIDGPVTAASTCTKSGTATAGKAQIEYSGSGPVTATVTVSES